MRLLVTGGTGVLGCALRPLAEAAGHAFAMPRHEELDLFDPSAVADAVSCLSIRLTGQRPRTRQSARSCRSCAPRSSPSGIYNVCRDGERVSAERFTRAAGGIRRRFVT